MICDFKKIVILAILTSSLSSFSQENPIPMSQTTPTVSLIYQKHHQHFGYHDKWHNNTSLASEPTQKPLAPSMTTGARFNEQYLNKEIALWVLRQINESMPIIEDAWVSQLIYDMTASMNATVRTQPLIATPIIHDNSINAFAVPGGLIGLNTGTILASGELDEVASVLAHEIAHLSQRHYEHRQDEKGKLLALQLGGLLTAIVASSVSGDLATTALIGSQTMMAESMATHSREHEKEADRVGMQILAQSGYDARAMTRFFERLYKQVSLHQSKDAFLPSFIQSHPLTADRLSEASVRAMTYPLVSMSAKESQAKDFDRLIWRLRYLTHQADISTLNIASKNSQGARLALVQALADKGRYDEALAVFERGNFDKTDPLSCIVKAHVWTKKGNHTQAVTVLTACQAIYPERRDLRLHLANAKIDANDGDGAIRLVKPLTDKTAHDRIAWSILQRAYEKSQSMHEYLSAIYALHARSQVELWGAKYQGALQSNAQAIKLAKEHDTSLLPMLENSKQAIMTARDYRP